MKANRPLIIAAIVLLASPIAYAFADPMSPAIALTLAKQFEESMAQTQLLRQAMEAAKTTADLARESLAAAREAKHFASHPEEIFSGLRDEAREFVAQHKDGAIKALQQRAMAEGLKALDSAMADPSVSQWQSRLQSVLSRAEGELQDGLSATVDVLHAFDPHRSVNDFLQTVQNEVQKNHDELTKAVLDENATVARNTLATAEAAILSSQANGFMTQMLSNLSAKIDAHLGNAQVSMGRALGVQRHVYDQLKEADVAWRARPLIADPSERKR